MTGASSLTGLLRLIQSAMQKGAGYMSFPKRQFHHLPLMIEGKQCALSFLDHKTHLGCLLNRQPLRLCPRDLLDL